MEDFQQYASIDDDLLVETDVDAAGSFGPSRQPTNNERDQQVENSDDNCGDKSAANE